jgi:hypothetical protein
MKEDFEVLEEAMENTYHLIMGETTVKQLLDRGDDILPFVCDPYNPSQKDIENLLDYFEGEEEYEKCSKIQEYLKSLKENLEN